MNKKEQFNKDSFSIFLVIAIVLFTLMGIATVYGQEQNNNNIGYATENEDIYGTWSSWDGTTIIYMDYGYENEPDTFTRISKTEDGITENSTGEFKVEEKYLYVQKVNDSYRLLFYLKGTQMIVMKPHDAGGTGQAWLLTKVSNYGTK